MTHAGGLLALQGGTSVKGNMQCTGGTMTMSNSSMQGNMTVSEGIHTIGPGSSIAGDLQFQDFPVTAGTNQICGASIMGNLTYQNSGTAAQVGGTGCAGNIVMGNLQVQNNTAATTMDSNAVGGNVQVQNNTAASRHRFQHGRRQCSGE